MRDAVKRVSARYVPRNDVNGFSSCAAVAAIHRSSREREERALVALLLEQPAMRWYSVEIARQLNIPVGRAVLRLRSLERSGLLSSYRQHSPISGMGRRYYYLKAR